MHLLRTIGRHSGGRRDAEGDLLQLRDVAEDPSIESAVEVVRAFLDMEVAYTTTVTPTAQIFDSHSGDGESFGVEEGTVMDIEDTYCHRVLQERLPSIMPDVRGDPRTASLPITVAADVEEDRSEHAAEQPEGKHHRQLPGSGEN